MMTTKRDITMPEHWRVWFRRVADGELPQLPDLPGDASAEARMWFAVASGIWLIIERSDATLEWDRSKALAWKKPAPTWKAEAETAISSARTLCDFIAHNPGAAQAARPFIYLALKTGSALVEMEVAFGVGDQKTSMASYLARRAGGLAKKRTTSESIQPAHNAICVAMRAQMALRPQPSRTKAAKHVAKAIRDPRTGKFYTFRTVLRIAENAGVRW